MHARRTHWVAFAAVAAAALAADQATKAIVRATLDLGEAVPAVGPFSIHHVRNSGILGGHLQGTAVPIAFASALGLAALVVYVLRRRNPGPLSVIGFGLLLGGGLGNLVDRVFRSPGPLQGHVVDVVSLFAPDGSVWPVFNLADSCIVSGGVLLVLLALRGRELDGTRSGRTTTGSDA